MIYDLAPAPVTPRRPCQMDAIHIRFCKTRASAFDVFHSSLAKKLKRSLSKLDDLSFTIFFSLIVGLDLLIGNRLDHLNDLFRFSDQADELLVFRLQELEQRPYRDVLKCCISAREKPLQVAVNSPVWFSPVLNKDGVIANYTSSVQKFEQGLKAVYLLTIDCQEQRRCFLGLRCFGSLSME
jgi:hypothetical protein